MRLSLMCALLGGTSVLIALSGCGSGGGGGASGGGQAPNPLWVRVDTQNLPETVAAGHVDLSGEAYCDSCPPPETALGYCPDIKPSQSSNVGVSWKNKTTGATGDAFHGITGSCSCLFSYCVTSYSHKWLAQAVPVTIGDNVIEILAQGSGFSVTAPITLTSVPRQPQGLVASAGTGDVTLRWSSVSEAASYNLYCSTAADSTPDTATRIAGVTSPFDHTGLTSDTTYYYFVTAVNGRYEGPVSQTVFATPGWQAEVLAPTAATARLRDTSIALDSADSAHIHYSFDETVGNLTHNYYLTNVSGAWASFPVGNPIDVDADIALGPDDTVHVSYIDFHGATHATYSSGTWNPQVIDARGWCDTSLAIDSANQVHAAYYASSPTAGELWYASNGSGAWLPGVVGTFPQDAGCRGEVGTLSLALAATGTAHIAFSGRYPDYGLKYSSNRDGAWVTETVGSGYVPHVSLAVDNGGMGHIAYTDNAGNLKYARQDLAGRWTNEVIESGAAPGHPSIKLDAAGQVHISYIAGDRLKYARNATGSWRAIILDGSASSDTALGLDSLGKAHISYFSSGNLKYITNR